MLGRAVFTLWVSDGNDHWISATFAFYVRREVRFTDLNASPEPVRKGARITVSGHLARLAYNRSGQARWIPYPGKPVDIYRRPKGSSWMRFHTVASTTTTSTGYFVRRLTAAAPACFTAFSIETDDLYARELASKWGDCVDVR